MTKLDGPLEARLVKHRRAHESGRASAASGDMLLDVSIRHTGSADEILAIGIERASVYPGIVFGAVHLRDLEVLAALPQVTLIEAQNELRGFLDVSVPDAHVPPLWSGSPSLRGSGVVVGVVDSGIDVFHHAFRMSNGKTRILSLWDQTIDETPHPTGFTYGKEFTGKVSTTNDIDTVLESSSDNPRFASLDVDGHGTHVAGIAAGDGSQAGNCHGSDHYVGVAPEADLIIVKRSLTRDQSYVDGVNYIFQKAGTKAAVANLSIGTSASSHDGTSAAETALDQLMSAAPAGRAVVVAAGNTADDGQHAHRTVGANGNESVRFTVLADDPFYLSGDIWYGSSGPVATPGPGATADLRVTLHAPNGTSKSVTASGSSLIDEAFAGGQIDFFARRNVRRAGRHSVTFTLSPPKEGTLMAGEWRIQLQETAGTATEVDCWLTPHWRWRLEDTLAANATKRLKLRVPQDTRGTDTAEITYTGTAKIAIALTTPDPDSTTEVLAGAGTVTRDAGSKHEVFFNSVWPGTGGQHSITFSIRAKKAGDNIDKGDWTVTLVEKAGHATDFTAVFPRDRVSTTVTNAAGHNEVVLNWPRFIEADRDRTRSVESPGAANNVITVGAYDPGTNNLADFSSRGPTVDGRQKPDLSAPGVGITAAKTRVKDSCCVSDCCETFYTDLQGTSMAAPHVTGTVALMFQRNHTLTYVAVRNALRNHVTTVPGADLQAWGQGKLNAQAAVMSVAAASSGGGSGGGGSGGGGGGGPSPFTLLDDPVFLPPRATWPLQFPTPERLQTLYEMLAASPIGQTIAALLSMHFDEVKAIINRSRKAAAMWHRMAGPELLKIVLAWPGEPRPFLPEKLDGRRVSDGIVRLLKVVAPIASMQLRADIDRYRTFLLALPGARLRDLGRLPGGTDGY